MNAAKLHLEVERLRLLLLERYPYVIDAPGTEELQAELELEVRLGRSRNRYSVPTAHSLRAGTLPAMFWIAIVTDEAGTYARFFRHQLPDTLEVDILGACEDQEAALQVVDALQAGLTAQGLRRGT